VPIPAWNFGFGLFFFCQRCLGPSGPRTYFTFGFFSSPFMAIQISVVDQHRFAADSDPALAFHFDAYPDPDPDPTLPYLKWKIRNFFDPYLQRASLHCFILVIRVTV
jgi:hypothetical protein